MESTPIKKTELPINWANMKRTEPRHKITMEIARNLTGVTMHEPGVSRLVSVDVGEAVVLAGVQ